MGGRNLLQDINTWDLDMSTCIPLDLAKKGFPHQGKGKMLPLLPAISPSALVGFVSEASVTVTIRRLPCGHCPCLWVQAVECTVQVWSFEIFFLDSGLDT